MDAILFGESAVHIISVLPYTAEKVIGYPDIKCSVSFTCHDVDEVGFHRRSPPQLSPNEDSLDSLPP
jgi:hypothetical protein